MNDDVLLASAAQFLIDGREEDAESSKSMGNRFTLLPEQFMITSVIAFSGHTA